MGNVHIRAPGEEHPSEPMIKQSSMKRVLQDKDHQYQEMRAHFEHKLADKNLEVGLHLHNEKNYLRIIVEKERLIYVSSGISFLVGGVIGWLIA